MLTIRKRYRPMKRICLILALFAASLTAPAALPTAVGDTIVDVEGARRVVLTGRGDSLLVDISGSGHNADYRFRYVKTTADSAAADVERRGARWDFVTPFEKNRSHADCEINIGGMGFGFVTPLGAPEGMHVDMRSSFEIFFEPLNVSLFTRNRRHAFSYGVGFNWRNFRLDGGSRFLKDRWDNLTIGAYPEGAAPDYSRIKLFSLTIPFRYRYYFTKDLSLGLAVIMSSNSYASIETRYKMDGLRMREFDKHIHQKKVTADFMLDVAFHDVGVYVKASPCRVLEPSLGPDFRCLSVGFSLCL